MSQQPQQLDLPQDARGVRDVIEDVVDLFDGYLLPSLRVQSGAHHPIAPFANDLLDAVSVRLSILCEELFCVHLSTGGPLREGEAALMSAGCNLYLVSRMPGEDKPSPETL